MAAARRGRQPTEVEFLRKLKKLSGTRTRAEFAQKCGRQPQNIGNYLNGNQIPGDGVLHDCLQHLYGWEIEPLTEMSEIPRQRDLPKSPGIYILYDSGSHVLYVGKAKDFSLEVPQTLNTLLIPIRCNPHLQWSYKPIGELAMHLSLYKIENVRLRHNIEALLLRVFSSHTYNSRIGHFR